MARAAASIFLLKRFVKGPIGVLRRALSKCLPSWAILVFAFLGGSILEVVTDVKLKNRLTATPKITGIMEVPDFDIAKAAGTGSLKKTV